MYDKNNNQLNTHQKLHVMSCTWGQNAMKWVNSSLPSMYRVDSCQNCTATSSSFYQPLVPVNLQNQVIVNASITMYMEDQGHTKTLSYWLLYVDSSVLAHFLSKQRMTSIHAMAKKLVSTWYESSLMKHPEALNSILERISQRNHLFYRKKWRLKN